MTSGLLDSLRFARGWRSPRRDLVWREVEIPVGVGSVSGGGGDQGVPGTLVAPPTGRPLPGWVVLHGITRPGRHHPGLKRFVSALASTGGRILIPEIREWTELDFAPDRSQVILQSAVRWLEETPDTAAGGVFLVGFSFGGPQALVAASDPGLDGKLRGVLAWGSYANLERTLRFQFTGEHGYGGTRHRAEPDPYGRWVVAANCLPRTAAGEDARDVAEALRDLAARAGDLQIPASHLSLEPFRSEVRLRVSPERRELFDLFAPPAAGSTPSGPGASTREAADHLVEAMARAARDTMPLLDPIARLGRIRVPVRLLHGRNDVLIPFTETLALAEVLRDKAEDVKTGITGLFAHSGGSSGTGSTWARTREGLHFLRVLRRVFEVG
jgi:pimeloyl-ACP methyl ester carboxylesterase